MLRSRAHAATVLLVVLAAALGAGCGSTASSGASSTSTSTSTSSSTSATAAASAAAALPASVAAELKRLGEVSAPRAGHVPPAPTDPNVERAYLTALFDDAQRVWRSEFATSHLSYHPARLIVFSGQTESACGPHKDSGPFYCPADEVVYLDLRFFTILLRLAHVGAAAQVFIVGHEVGHHVQRLLGIANHVDAASKADPSRKNALSIQVELEADCLAGVWAKSAYPRHQLNPSSLAEALKTAKVIGDDYIQQATGQVVDAAMWTHGSSAQRQQWLRAGYRSGRPSACNTFAAG